MFTRGNKRLRDFLELPEDESSSSSSSSSIVTDDTGLKRILLFRVNGMIS